MLSNAHLEFFAYVLSLETMEQKHSPCISQVCFLREVKQTREMEYTLDCVMQYHHAQSNAVETETKHTGMISIVYELIDPSESLTKF